MNYSNYRFTLDIQSNLSQVSLPVKLNDSGRRLLIGLTDGGNPYIISDGSMAKFTYKKAEPNSEGVYEAGIYDCVLEDNYSTIRFDLTSAVTSVAGVVDCEIRLYGPNGRLLTSPRFIMVVDERVIYDDDIPLSEGQASTIDAIILTEAARADAEANRVEAETARKEAEAERKTASENAVNNANTAATNAQAVADTLTQKLASGDYDGEDGLTPYIGANGNWWIGKVDTGNPSRGANGTDGVSATHSWNGTVLTIKSASGSSSADLKGDKGDKGYKGDKGEPGDPATSYPYGFLLVSTDPAPPTMRGIAGTWEAIPEGHTIVGAGSNYPVTSIGGSADAVIPQHNHSGLYYNAISEERRVGWSYGSSGGNYYLEPSCEVGNASEDNFQTGEAISRATNAIVTSDGTGKNMMPYVAYYAWIRIA